MISDGSCNYFSRDKDLIFINLKLFLEQKSMKHAEAEQSLYGIHTSL
jgi:hypothetical protein